MKKIILIMVISGLSFGLIVWVVPNFLYAIPGMVGSSYSKIPSGSGSAASVDVMNAWVGRYVGQVGEDDDEKLTIQSIADELKTLGTYADNEGNLRVATASAEDGEKYDVAILSKDTDENYTVTAASTNEEGETVIEADGIITYEHVVITYDSMGRIKTQIITGEEEGEGGHHVEYTRKVAFEYNDFNQVRKENMEYTTSKAEDVTYYITTENRNFNELGQVTNKYAVTEIDGKDYREETYEHLTNIEYDTNGKVSSKDRETGII